MYMTKLNEKIELIARYLSSYEDYVKLKNSVGLFDAAKLFELFAAYLCELYFGQPFNNLNHKISNYPSVDLISSDEKLFIQVTTISDLPSKIKGTLESLKDLSLPELANMEELYFFSLNNESVKKVKEFAGSKRIGSVDFKRSNLITTKDIFSKATHDPDFQTNLYSYLKRLDSSLEDSENIERETVTCKKSFLLQGKDTIGKSYRINVSKYIKEIQSDPHKNILIEGRAGVGKTTLCRRMFEKDKLVFYAKATQFLKASSLSDIWHFNVENDLEFLSDQKIVFVIDALEFATDLGSIPTLLIRLYEVTKEYTNVFIISSCRTSDKSAFISLFAEYDVSPHFIEVINDDELTNIAKEFPVVKKALTISDYSELIRIPFYLDMIVEAGDISLTENENTLKEKIWKRITQDDNHIAEVIKDIVLDRSKQFATGVNKDDYDSKVVNVLVSKNVLEYDETSDTIKLTYDIFEDICFERYIDRLFSDSKEDATTFFNALDQLGRAAYRRYQMWLDDKLLIKKDRELFVYNLLFSDSIPENWKNDTITGLIRSKNSDAFFNEFGGSIVEKGLLKAFIKNINLYGYEIDEIKTINPFLSLKSIGNGRKNVLHLIYTRNLHMSAFLESKSFEKMCNDFSNSVPADELVRTEATNMVQQQLDYFMNEAQEDGVYYAGLFKRIKGKLEILHQLCKENDEWVITFLNKIKALFVSEYSDEHRFASEVLSNLFERQNYRIAVRYQKEIYPLFELFYTHKIKEDFPFYQESDDKNSAYGLNDNAEEYEHRTFRQYPILSSFAYMYFVNKPIDGLKWLVSFINRCVDSYKANHNLDEYELLFFKNNELKSKKKYYGTEDHWLCVSVSNQVPTLLADLIYCYKEAIRTLLKARSRDETIKIATIVKDYIYNNSNNIMLLSIISEIGLEFFVLLPGYVLDLITNMNILFFDYQRATFQLNGNRSFLLTERYTPVNTNTHLSDYMLKCQLYYAKNLLQKCQSILDYLYSIYPNDKKNAQFNFQIQKMDISRAIFHKKDDGYILELSPTGEAKNYSDTISTDGAVSAEISKAVQDFDEKIKNSNYTLKECFGFIDLILNQTDLMTMMLYKEKALNAMAICLNNGAIETETRERYCDLRIKEAYNALSNSLFVRKPEFFGTLFEQLNKNINEEIKKRIKKLILDILNSGHQNGITSFLINLARRFLNDNKNYAILIFNTFLNLAKDEMNHQKFNANYIVEKEIEKSFVFKPNYLPHLKRIDRDIELKGDSTYVFNTTSIISDYLFDEKECNLDGFDIDDYDVQVLNHLFDCGLDLDNQSMYLVTSSFIDFLIRLWKENDYTKHEIISVYDAISIKDLLQRELLSETNFTYALKLLFENKDYSLFKSDAIDFYLDAFSRLPAYYFDGHKDETHRRHCEIVLHRLETIVTDIKNDALRHELERILIFSPGRYGLLGDWSKIKVSYCNRDKVFLGEMFKKYGFNHINDIVNVIFKFHYSELFPEILPTFASSLIDAEKNAVSASDRADLAKIITDNISTLHILNNSLFFDFGSAIKHNQEYISAYEGLLRVMVSFGDEQAAILLDSFRMH